MTGGWIKKRFFIALAAIAICLAVGTATRFREPTYKGWTMHEWLQETRNEHQYESVIILGTNNLPLLIKRIASDERGDRILSGYRQLPPWLRGNEAVTKSLLRRSRNRTTAAEEAKRVLEIVGPRATAAIPQLIKLARENPEAGHRVVDVLDWMGEPGERALISLTDHTNQNLVSAVMMSLNWHKNSPLSQSISNLNNARSAIAAMQDFGDAAQTAIPALTNCLSDTHNPAAQRYAIATLGSLKASPQISIPAILPFLKSEDPKLRWYSATALGQFGHQAVSAVPALTNAMTDPDSTVRRCATEALRQIAPATFTNTPAQ